MKTIVHLLCIVACLPTLAASLEDRLDEIAAVEGVVSASIVMDADGKAPELRDMPEFPGWRIARIAFLIVDEDAVQDNTVAVVIDPDGNALWSQRAPAILAPKVVRTGPIGTDSEIIAAVEQAQTIKALKYEIEHDEKGADVTIVVDVSGKAVRRNYRVYLVDDAYIVKPYDATEAATK